MKPGRNEPCSCGSGKKFKHCCLGKPNSPLLHAAAPSPAEISELISMFNAGYHHEVENRARVLLGHHPDSGVAWKLLGASLQGQGKDCLPALQRAADLLPDNAEAHNNLGNALQHAGQHARAVTSCRHALTLRPDFAEAHNNLGNALQDLGQLDDAIAHYHRALSLKPDLAAAHYNLGGALKALGKLQEAAVSYRRALQITPGSPVVLHNLGCVLQDMGESEDAIACYRRALAISPDYTDTHSNLLFSLNYTGSLSPADRLKEAQQYGRVVTRKATAPFSSWICPAQPERLRVGIISSDLRNHPVGYFLESLLAKLDPKRIELIAYPPVIQTDTLTKRIKPYFSAWKPLLGLSDESAARLIHSDGVHILLDLAGHTSHNRLPIFAWKPAPIQTSWLGYFATTGVAEMDYLLADQISVPETHRQYFTETIRYLPGTRLCFSPPEIDVPVTSLPALNKGYITYGCFQNLSKIGDVVLAAWAKILSTNTDARLRLQCPQLNDSTVRTNLVLRMQKCGIPPARVNLHGFAPRSAYLAAHAEVDILLDTFPYPGGTTTCEALWMGVPTLTLAGDTLLARQGASMLGAVGLNDWVTNSSAEYVERAVALASDLPKLSSLRATLREQASNSPLFDAPRFARNLEAELWSMWQGRAGQLIGEQRICND